ncbi:bifunctional hydroxymethylpyrimidine kinase/phosphomethylpyrimidine kinase, partial [Acinetobacter baumannii]|nr:bifunctional hydroxymethylpyrimidine kinase/phosphomethylpyrimidine kinase [Acinetobacter baumannii]
VEEMKRLCEKADIICPNITEACLLLHQPYKESFSEKEIKKMLKELCKFGSQKAIMTGVSLQKNSIGAYGYDADNDTYTYYFT